MSFKSSALQEKFEKPLFECGHIPKGEELDLILSFKSDQQKEVLYDLIRPNGQGQKDFSLVDKDRWTINSKHTRNEELPEEFRLPTAEVLGHLERAKNAYVNPAPAMGETLDIYQHNLQQLAVTIKDFKVFELPSLFSSPYDATAYLQYLLVIDLLTCLMKDAVQAYTVYLCDTHITKEDFKLFAQTFEWLAENKRRSLDIHITSDQLGKTLEDVSNNALGANVLVMVKPLNPVRQLLQHIMIKYSGKALPPLIICNKATADIPIEKKPEEEQTYMARQSRRYEGDRTSDLVEKFFNKNYHAYPFVANVPPVEKLKPGHTVDDSAAVSDLVKDLVIYIRKDVYKAVRNKLEWAKHWDPSQKELSEMLNADLEAYL